MATTYAAVVAATRRYYRRDPRMRARLSELLDDLFSEFGWRSRLCAAVGGPFLHWTTRREEKRLARGWTYEPPTFYEHNEAAYTLDDAARRGGERCTCVTPAVPAKRDGIALVDDRIDQAAGDRVATPVDV
jgi:hypothetical protein